MKSFLIGLSFACTLVAFSVGYLLGVYITHQRYQSLQSTSLSLIHTLQESLADERAAKPVNPGF